MALSGIQYAGGHLKELQRAFKNPAANLGLIFKEVTNRAYRKVGLGGTDLSNYVDPSLQESAKLCAQVMNLIKKRFWDNILIHIFLSVSVNRRLWPNCRATLDQTRQKYR